MAASKLPSAQPWRIRARAAGLVAGGDQRFAQPDAADGGVGRLGRRTRRRSAAGGMSGVIAASARACSVPRSGQVRAVDL